MWHIICSVGRVYNAIQEHVINDKIRQTVKDTNNYFCLASQKNRNCTTSKTASKIRLRIYVIRNILASNKRQL